MGESRREGLANHPDSESCMVMRRFRFGEKEMASGSCGQSGDTQGLSNVAEADAESIKELIEVGTILRGGND